MFSLIVIHELTHLLVAIILGQKAKSIYIHMFGLTLTLESNTSRLVKSIILISGPFANLLLAVLNICPEYNYFIFIFNILLIYPLDGFNIATIFIRNRLLLHYISIVISVFIFVITLNPIYLPICIYIIYLNIRKILELNFHKKLKLIKNSL